VKKAEVKRGAFTWNILCNRSERSNNSYTDNREPAEEAMGGRESHSALASQIMHIKQKQFTLKTAWQT
jgi:hypothetical protein